MGCSRLPIARCMLRKPMGGIGSKALGAPTRRQVVMCRLVCVSLSSVVALLATGCGDGSTEADRVGVGAQCTANAECESPDEEIELVCLTQFTGGYCGLEGCEGDVGCPDGSACVTHDDGENYCFRLCAEKPECNQYRSTENEANCSSNVDFVDGKQDRKACVPPSSGV